MKPNEFTKVDDSTIGVVETVPEKVLPLKTYDYGFLKKQLISIQDQRDRDNALRDAELAEVQSLIEAADNLGIVEKEEAISVVLPGEIIK